MSIFFDFHVGPRGRKLRRAIYLDRCEIELFTDKQHTQAIFGDVDIGALIELSTLAICLINEEMKVLGFMALHDHPNVPSVPASDWESWLRNMFHCNFLPHNTLFIHMMCCAEAVNEFFLHEAITSVFNNDEYLLHIVLVAPPTCTHDDLLRYKPFRKHIIKKIASRRAGENGDGHHIYVAYREDFYSRLTVRAAVEEDNDDVVEILDKLHPSLKTLYGDYYLSEIIGRHPECQRKVVVAQQHDTAVGVMCLNSKIDYSRLLKTYDLAPHFGLKKVTGPEKEKLRRTRSSVVEFGEAALLRKRSYIGSPRDLSRLLLRESPLNKAKMRSRKASSHVIFKRNSAMRRSFDQFFNKHSDDYSDKIYMGSRTPSLVTEVSPRASLLLDEDPFDYDIVNIDSNLLTVPEVPPSLEKYSSSLWLDEPEPIMKYKPKKISTVFKRSKKRAKLLPQVEEPEKEYRGEPNAFSIEIYALRDDIDERKGYDMLVAAFEIMKHYDYCLLRMPCDSSPMYLLRHFCFIPCKNKVCSDYALYIAHRSSVLGKMTVRKAEIVDVPQISKFVQNLDSKETKWIVKNSILGKNQHEAYIFVCGMDIVGFGILEPPEQLDFLQAKYNMDSFRIQKYHHSGHGINTGFSYIKTALVYPVFEAHFRFFLRETMRLSGVDTLIWLTGYRNKWVKHKANSMAVAMIPLMPRKSEPFCCLIPELKKIGNLSKNIMAFSSWLITTKLTSITRLNIDTRIVVVGASRTAMGFLNNLLFSDASSYLTFTSVTLISPCGLPYIRHHEQAAEMMFPRYSTATDNFLKSTPYTYYLHVEQGTVVEINKQYKYITTSNGLRYSYDKLFLLIGKQYQHPDYLKAVLERERNIIHGITPSYTRLDDPSLREPQIVTSYDTPRNVFIVNTVADAHRALRLVKNIMLKNNEDKIIVYGLSLEVYCCIAALLKMDFPARQIVFVEPFPSENPRQTRVPVFNNTYVDQMMSEVFDELGITVLRSYYFQSWQTDIYDEVTHVSFLSHFQMTEVKCAALFYYGTRDIDADIFQAIHKSGLVYDQGILIDHECRTKDSSIYAAGPATRYCARYFAETRAHHYYDSYEVGEKLGTRIRNQLDPLFSEKSAECRTSMKSVSFDSTIGSIGRPSFDNASFCGYKSPDSKLQPNNDFENLPVFLKPIVKHCVMPGGLQYLEVRSPGMKIPHPYVQSLNFTGFVMETFKSGYFKLHLTKDFVVDGITCLSPVKYSLAHFKALYGKSAVLLNNIHIRYTAKKVDDFYEFFISPGIIFLYHEHIHELFSLVKELLPLGKPDGETLSEALTAATEKSKKLSTIRSKFEKSPHVEAITAYVLEWVSQNELLLPMYLQPWQRPYYSHDLERHPAFDPALKVPRTKRGAKMGPKRRHDLNCSLPVWQKERSHMSYGIGRAKHSADYNRYQFEFDTV